MHLYHEGSMIGVQCQLMIWRVTGALFWVKNIKVPFGIGHPHLHIKPSLYVCRRVQGPKSSNRIELS